MPTACLLLTPSYHSFRLGPFTDPAGRSSKGFSARSSYCYLLRCERHVGYPCRSLREDYGALPPAKLSTRWFDGTWMPIFPPEVHSGSGSSWTAPRKVVVVPLVLQTYTVGAVLVPSTSAVRMSALANAGDTARVPTLVEVPPMLVLT